MSRAEVFLPDEVCARAAWDNNGPIGVGRHVVINREPERCVGINDVIQPRAPEVNVHNWAGIRANKIVGQCPWTGVPDVKSTIGLWRLNELHDVSFRASVRLGVSGAFSEGDQPRDDEQQAENSAANRLGERMRFFQAQAWTGA